MLPFLFLGIIRFFYDYVKANPVNASNVTSLDVYSPQQRVTYCVPWIPNCEEGLQCCFFLCTNTTSNTGNCGGCGAICVVGSPPACCDGVCTDLNSSVDNCGACDAPQCTGTQPACCSGVCKDLDNNFASCGACDITCTDQVPACCSGSCSDLATDPEHCGSCNASPCLGEQPDCLIPYTAAPAPPFLVLVSTLPVVQGSALMFPQMPIVVELAIVLAKQISQPAAPEPAPTQPPTQTTAADAAANVQAPSPPVVTGYAQILARIPPIVAAARPSRAWALDRHVAQVPVQIWRLLTTVDLVRRFLFGFAVWWNTAWLLLWAMYRPIHQFAALWILHCCAVYWLAAGLLWWDVY
ncbi:hypothetical protein N7471_011074 [Penicillium samsonianum]|uniref:uncharacterized protein n=1 Tax=Penicillium samsonianum TaxID=1882272 RepID=UPI0025477110|nr:uncharacterized protein N7471_011074 [Penicillium samsonianum]KAJ6123757.1 hypothetical protein N7471_011074 [Penicillium samsonianum]